MPAKFQTRNLTDPFGDRVRSQRRPLSPAANKVVKYIDANRTTALTSSAAELAASIGTSDATVIRAVQALGFDGLPELRQALAATLEHRSTPADDMRRTLADVGETTERAIDRIFEMHERAFAALRSPEMRAKIAQGVLQLNGAQRIVVFGVGPSAPLAQYAGILMTRTGRAARTLDATGSALADQLLDLRERDALLVLAYGRAYREVIAVFTEAVRRRLPIVLVSDSLERKLARRADVVIPASRGETERVALHGATLVVLEMIVLGLAACDRKAAMEALQDLNDLRELVTGIRAHGRWPSIRRPPA